MNRRELLQGLMAGGMVIAGELIMPSTKLISIPSGKVFTGFPAQFMIHEGNIRWVGDENGTATVLEFYDWVKKYADQMLDDHWNQTPESLVSLKGDHRMTSPERLVGGSIAQASSDIPRYKMREIWCCPNDLNDDSLVTDKFYYREGDLPRERITMTDEGNRGYR